MRPADLARASGLSQGFISQVLHGQTLTRPKITSPGLIKIANALRVSLAELLGEEHGIPVLSKIAAGDPRSYTDGDYPTGYADRFIPAPTHISDPHMFALEIEGDSMAPRFPKGTYVYCAPSIELHEGDYAVVRIGRDGLTTCKIWRTKDERVILCSVNSEYPPQEYGKSEIAWAYPVVWYGGAIGKG